MFAKLFVDSLNVQNISRFISERHLLSYITTILALTLIFYDIYIDAPICVLPTGTEKIRHNSNHPIALTMNGGTVAFTISDPTFA